MRALVPLVALAVLGAAAGCSGGRQGGAVPAPAPSGQSPAQYRVTFLIDVPAQSTTAASRRRPQYISPATTQMVVNIQQNGSSVSGYPVTVSLTPTSGGCTSTLANTSCQLSFSLAPGSYSATLTAQDASAQALSAAQSVAFTVVVGSNNTVAITLSGIPQEMDIAPGARAVHGSQSAGLVLYGSSPQPFIVNVRDVDGNIIVGPGSPTYSVSVLSGSGWTPAAPSSTAPNVFTLTPPGTNGAGALLRVTATYSDATCTRAGAVCSATFSVKNDIQTLFIANQASPEGGNTVTEYAPPYTGTPTTISNGVYLPFALVLDAYGNLFVANEEGGSTVTEYAPPYSGTPTTISNGVNEPFALALDAAGDLFVANTGGSTVTEYAPPYSGTPTTISNGVNKPFALALDAAGDLFVANTGGNTVTEYAPPYSGTPTTISTGVNQPYALALDAAGDLFVANEEGSTVTEYAPPYSGTPTTISNGVNLPIALALDAAGDLFVGNAGLTQFVGFTVTEYAPPYTGTPATISKGVYQPYALALDGAGDLFVANHGLSTVTEFAPPYSGTPTTISNGVIEPYALVLTP